MTEFSQFWDGTTLGDATQSPYTSAEFGEAFVPLLGGGTAGSASYLSYTSFAGYGLGALLVTGTVSPVGVAAGHAFVYGKHYVNDGAPALTVAIPTPGANPRRDRIVLRVDWAAQTIRAVRLAGAEAATPTAPALTQTAGTTWEYSLATVYITTGGVITVTDERVSALGLGQSVFFRDIRDRVFEEWFTNWNTTPALEGFSTTLVGTGATNLIAGPPSALTVSSGATNGGSAIVTRNTVAVYPSALNQAPLLGEARITPLNAAADAQTSCVIRFSNSGASQMIEFGVLGTAIGAGGSNANLVLRATNAGATTFITGQAIDTSGAYHTLGIYVAASGGPAIAIYDGVPIGQVSANLPAAATGLRFENYANNGTTSAVRAQNVDWARVVRGTA